MKKDSEVEMVACQADVAWSEGVAEGPSGDPQKPMDEEGSIGVAEDDVWLKLRVDGKEGWMNSVEDFSEIAATVAIVSPSLQLLDGHPPLL